MSFRLLSLIFHCSLCVWVGMRFEIPRNGGGGGGGGVETLTGLDII